MSIQLRQGFQGETLNRVLEDLLVRFVINAPPEDLSSNSRVFFLFEEAHWFYLDYVRTVNPSLPSLRMKTFSKMLIELFPLIWKGGDPDEALKEFVSYKQSIPVRGAALFNANLNKILLVQGVESSSWSFPRGKISKDEDDADCAVREVREEIGFDISPYLNKDDYVERTFKGKNYRIYLCKNIPEGFDFKPIVRNEINEISWKDFKKVSQRIKNGNGNSKYFLINSMIRPIQQWITRNKGEVNETQLKLEVEAQLKSLLGIGEEFHKPEIDPGRELLDFIKKSAANKQQRDQQTQQAQSQGHDQAQQPSNIPPPVPYPALQQFPSHPPFPIMGFQPPQFGQLPFINPFIPPQSINSIPPFLTNLPPFPPTPMYASLPPPQHQQFQPPPSADQLSRPSFNTQITKNEQQSRELLSILNKPADDKKSTAKELLNFLNRTGDTKPSSVGTGSSGTNDHSKSLLALLSRKPNEQPKTEKVEATSEQKPANPPSSSASQALLDLIKPKQKSSETEKVTHEPKKKLILLKREDSAPTNDSISSLVTEQSETSKASVASIDDEVENFYEDEDSEFERFEDFDEDEEEDNGIPASQELLDLIRQSKQRQKTDSFEAVNEVQPADDKEVEQFESESEFEEAQEFQEPANVDQTSLASKLPPASNESLAPLTATAATSTTATAASKPKFQILKRGEDLGDFLKEDEIHEPDAGGIHPQKGEEQPEEASKSTNYTIQFSDDGVEEEAEKVKQIAEKPNENLKAKNEIMSLLHGYKPSAQFQTLSDIEAKIDTGVATTPICTEKQNDPSASLLNLLHKKPIKPSPEPIQHSVDISTVEKDIDSLNLSPPSQSPNPMLSLLKGNGQSPSPQLTQSHVQPQPVQEQQSAPQQRPGADLLSLLRRKPAPHAVEPVFHNTNGKPANDLLNLLHKSQEQTLSPAPQQHFQNTTGSSANDLLSLLHKK